MQKEKKKIGRPHSMIYYNTKFLQEKTCKQTIWESSYGGFSGIHKMCLRLINWKSFKNVSQQKIK